MLYVTVVCYRCVAHFIHRMKISFLSPSNEFQIRNTHFTVSPVLLSHTCLIVSHTSSPVPVAVLFLPVHPVPLPVLAVYDPTHS